MRKIHYDAVQRQIYSDNTSNAIITRLIVAMHKRDRAMKYKNVINIIHRGTSEIRSEFLKHIYLHIASTYLYNSAKLSKKRSLAPVFMFHQRKLYRKKLLY